MRIVLELLCEEPDSMEARDFCASVTSYVERAPTV